jgi:hypothetical protein
LGHDGVPPAQLAFRVSSTSVTVITPGAGCSIRSTMTVSTTGFFTRRTTFGAAFFTGAGLGLALATVRFVAFAALATLRALPRLAELRRFARFCTFARPNLHDCVPGSSSAGSVQNTSQTSGDLRNILIANTH